MNIIQNIYIIFLKNTLNKLRGELRGPIFSFAIKHAKNVNFHIQKKIYISVNNVDRAFYLFFMFKLDKNNRTVIEGQNSVSQAVLMKKINQNPFFAQICDFYIF